MRCSRVDRLRRVLIYMITIGQVDIYSAAPCNYYFHCVILNKNVLGLGCNYTYLATHSMSAFLNLFH